MLRRLAHTIRERALIRRGGHVVAACSGGADSVALLHGLWFLRDRIGFHLSACHLHHGLRGAEADADEALVTEWCARRGIPLLTGHASVPDWQAAHGGSVEMAARAVRHAFFLDVLRQTRADAIALAHQRDDQAETVLMRILSGCGMDGLGGMDYRSEPAPGLVLIRPLLDVSRDQVIAFLRRYRLAWREDASNCDEAMTRNRVRHRLMPSIAAAGFPAAADALVRLAEVMREESRFADEQLRRLRLPVVPHPLPLRQVRRRCVAEQRRMLRAWLGGGGNAGRDVDFTRLEQVRGLIGGDRAAPVGLGAAGWVVCREGALHWSAVRPDAEARAGSPAGPVALAVPGVTDVPALGVRVEVTPAVGYRRSPVRLGAVPSVAYLRREQGAVPAWTLRSRREGDRIAPTGLDGRVSLKELMINHKIPASRRAAIPVLCAGDEVLWVAGFRVARAWAVAGQDAPSWRVRIERMPA